VSNWLSEAVSMQMLAPAAVVAVLFVATFVLEDVATVAGGLLAGQMTVGGAEALAAVLAGTVAGDLALYAVGRWFGRSAFAARLRARSGGRGEALIRRRGLFAVVVARFIPGTRLPVFFASGVVGMGAVPVALTLTATTLVWTPALFWTSRAAGTVMGPSFSPPFLAVAAVCLAAAFLLPRFIARFRAPEA